MVIKSLLSKAVLYKTGSNVFPLVSFALDNVHNS